MRGGLKQKTEVFLNVDQLETGNGTRQKIKAMNHPIQAKKS